MKQSWILALLLLIAACSTTKPYQELRKSEITVSPGVGFLDFKVGETDIYEVQERLGKKYEEIVHNVYSIEIKYKKLGLSFYYKYADSTKTIFAISCYSPFKAVTTDGIKLYNSTMLDVKELHGELDWFTSDGSNYWGSEHNGIEYFVEKDPALPQFPLDEEVHEKRTIIMIDIDIKED